MAPASNMMNKNHNELKLPITFFTYYCNILNSNASTETHDKLIYWLKVANEESQKNNYPTYNNLIIVHSTRLIS